MCWSAVNEHQKEKGGGGQRQRIGKKKVEGFRLLKKKELKIAFLLERTEVRQIHSSACP